MTTTNESAVLHGTANTAAREGTVDGANFSSEHLRAQALMAADHLRVPLFRGAKASAPEPELFDLRPLWVKPSLAADPLHAREKLDGWAVTAYNELPHTRKGFKPTRMVLLIADLDAGDLSADAVQAHAMAFYGAEAIAAIYSTASSLPEAKRWRVVVPLAHTVDLPTWALAQRAFAEYMLAQGITVDASMERSTQISFTPNVPVQGRDPFTGEPLHFVHVFWGSVLFDTAGVLTPTAQTAVQIVQELDARAAAEADAQRQLAVQKAAERQAQRELALANGGDGMSIVQRFNATHDTAALLLEFGYTKSPEKLNDWRSPLQTSGTYATRLHADGSWFSLSGTDAAAGLGKPMQGGVGGDAFDLLVHYKHGGNYGAAVADVGAQTSAVAAFSGVPLPAGVSLAEVMRPFGGAVAMPLDGNGRITATRVSLEKALRSEGMCHRLGFDTFKHAVMVNEPGGAEWRELKETDVFSVGHCLEGRGFKPPAKELLRDAINAVAELGAFDSAQNWLAGLTWDGVPRVREFLAKGFGAEAGEYSEAIGLYLWTALAGRVIEPGCKADMVPVAQGTQGIRKSSAVQALSPSPEFFAELDLGVKEEDLNRLMKGRMVLEMGELAGMRAREVEGLKRFVAAQRNLWVEKWATVPTTYARRCVFVGTTNADTFLADSTGSRRWLPFRAGVTGVCDPDWIAANRDQLWAEGAALFRANGVHWRDAERLARDVHEEFTVQDSWDALIAKWLETPGFDGSVPSASFVTTVDVLVKALNIQAGQVSRANETRAGAVLQRLGFNRVRRRVDGSLKWVYAKS